MKEPKNLYERIQQLQRLTNSEAKIVDFIHHAHSRIAFEKVTSIAQKANVGKASVVRFISRLGFESFRDFQKCVQEEIQERLEKPIERFLSRERSIKIKNGEADSLGQGIAQIMKNLREAHERIKPEQFNEAIRLLSLSKGAIYVAGNLTSFGLAYYFWIYARYLRDRVHLINNLGSALPYQLLDVKSRDILFVITHHLYSKQTQLIVEYFAQQGSNIIMLSDTEINPFSHLAKILLVAPCDSISLFDSSTALLAVMESLVAGMDKLLQPTIFDRFKSADDLFGHLDVFVPSQSHRKNNHITNSSNHISKTILSKKREKKSGGSAL